MLFQVERQQDKERRVPLGVCMFGQDVRRGATMKSRVSFPLGGERQALEDI